MFQRVHFLLRGILPTILAALFLTASPSWATPALTFEAGAVVIAEATPESDVVLYRLSREWTGRTTRIRETADVLTAEPDGTARFDLAAEEEVPRMSVWVAVDLATGETALASPAGFEARPMSFPGREPAAAGAGQLRRLDLEGHVFHVLWARPDADPAKQGAWSAAVGDGGVLDDDGPANGRMGMDLVQMSPLGTFGPPPETLTAGDVLVVLDPTSLEYFLTTLPGPPAALQGGE